jgi:hypothetical protein
MMTTAALWLVLQVFSASGLIAVGVWGLFKSSGSENSSSLRSAEKPEPVIVDDHVTVPRPLISGQPLAPEPSASPTPPQLAKSNASQFNAASKQSKSPTKFGSSNSVRPSTVTDPVQDTEPREKNSSTQPRSRRDSRSPRLNRELDDEPLLVEVDLKSNNKLPLASSAALPLPIVNSFEAILPDPEMRMNLLQSLESKYPDWSEIEIRRFVVARVQVARRDNRDWGEIEVYNAVMKILQA